MPETTVRALDLLEWNGVTPDLSVVKTSPDDHATETFSVIADYGWAERVLCADCYRQDAELLVGALQEAIDRG